MTEEVWTEVLNERLAAVWAWDGQHLGVVPITLGEDVVLDQDTVGAISRYAQDKETNLSVQQMYDESDYDGTLRDFMHEEVGGVDVGE